MTYKKYIVGNTNGDVYGCYYGTTEEEAIRECRDDCLYAPDGTKITYRTGTDPLTNVRATMIAVEQLEDLGEWR